MSSDVMVLNGGRNRPEFSVAVWGYLSLKSAHHLVHPTSSYDHVGCPYNNSTQAVCERQFAAGADAGFTSFVRRTKVGPPCTCCSNKKAALGRL